jgi:hypothetical protein
MIKVLIYDEIRNKYILHAKLEERIDRIRKIKLVINLHERFEISTHIRASIKLIMIKF